MTKKRIPPKTIFIACEGKNTEPIYFERIKEEIEEDNLYALTIYPDRTNNNHKSDPIGLITEAQNNINNYDEVWVVYDKDGYTKHKEALDKANLEINGKKVNVAFSSIAFEQWILLHFEKNSLAYDKSKDIIENKFLANEKYYEDYEKTGTVDIYPYIKGNTSQALENVAWLKYKMKNNLNNHPIYEVNPFTNIDILVKKILNINEVIIWCSINDGGISISNIDVVFEFNDNLFSVYIRNNKTSSIVLNEIKFYRNEEIESLSIPNKIIEPTSVENVEISVEGLVQLTICYGHIKAIIEL